MTTTTEQVQPMPNMPRTFQAGFVLAHKDGASRYKLTTEAIWDGATFVSGVVTCIDKNGSFIGSYPIKASSDWFVGYVERVGSTCAACGIPGAAVSCGSDGVICKNCNDVRPWSQVQADIHARRTAAAPSPVYGDKPSGCRVLPLPANDPYLDHNEKLVGRLISDARFTAGKTVDQLVSESMLIEDNAPDLWKGEKTTPRERLAAALAKEMGRPVTARFVSEARQDRALPVSNGFGRRGEP